VPLIPAVLPLWAYLASGAAAFVVARAAQAGAGTAPTPGEPIPGGPPEDSLWQSFGGGSTDFSGQFTGPGGVLPPYSTPGPGQPGDPILPPVAPPAPAPAPSAPLCWTYGPARPAGATRWVKVLSTHFRLYTLTGGAAVPTVYFSANFSAWLGGNVTLKTTSGGTATFAKILSGGHLGKYLHTSDPGVTIHVCPAGTR